MAIPMYQSRLRLVFVGCITSICSVLLPVTWTTLCSAQEPGAEEKGSSGIEFFETQIRPVLAQHCYVCHGPDKQKGNLRLDNLPSILQGGESGPAILLGDPENSLLVQAVRYESLQMPPTGKITTSKIDALKRWIAAKAPVASDFARPRDPSDSDSAHSSSNQRRSEGITEKDRSHWAFQPIANPVAPSHPSQPDIHPIDAWIFDRLQREGLVPTRRASTRELVRRVTFTLTGLPPSFQALEHWTSKLDSKPNDALAHGAELVDEREAESQWNAEAYRELIDTLLESPAYAEHWARHWLDVVRFAQSNGYERDGYKPHAWKYRDYVVESFKTDKPYNQFLVEQLAGDELPNANASSRIATGFYRLGVWDDEPDDKRQAEFDDLDDIMVTIGSTFMGLSIGCARCHDHKFDPIPQSDYYSMLACIRNIQRYSNPENNIENSTSFPLVDDALIRERMKTYRDSIQAVPNGGDKSLGIADWGLVVRESNANPPETHVLIRGNAATPGAAVQPGFLQVLASTTHPDSSVNFFCGSESPLHDLFPSSGRRLGLARWLASPNHPLTSRVLVNRLWHYHFGRGIVATTADFGIAGGTPSHPELLDHLATEFLSHGWSIKHMHRYILTSQAFQRSSRVETPDGTEMTKDPGNRLLWRQNIRRLQAESIRDSLLNATGELNQAVGGVEMYPKLSGEVLAGQSKPGLDWRVSPAEQRNRKSLYAVVKRSVRDPLLETFDYSNTTSPLTERPVTTVATQSLMLLNSRFTAERAATLSQKIIALTAEPKEQTDQVYRAVLQRHPTESELAISVDSLDRMKKAYTALADQMHFRTDVPVSLFSGYRQQLPGSDFFLTPETIYGTKPWQSYSGLWGGGYEGIDVVDKAFGPFVLLKRQEFRDGVVQGKLRMDRTTELATLILRTKQIAVANQGSRWSGVALRFDPVNQVVTLEQRQPEKREPINGQLGTSEPTIHDEARVRLHHKIPVEQWIPFRFQLQGDRAMLWLNDIDESKPLLELQLDSQQGLGGSDDIAGTLGVAVWGGTLAFDPLVLQTDEPQGSSQDATTGLITSLARARDIAESNEPPKHWTSYAGDWTLRSDGILKVGPEQGPKLIWDQATLRDGEVSVDLKFASGASNIGGLILRVSEPKIGADNWLGYEVSLNMTKKTILFGEHRNNWTPLAEVPAEIEPDRWHRLKARTETLSDGQLKLSIFLDDQATPILIQTLSAPLPGDGIGLRTWGSQIEYRNFVIRRGSEELRPDWSIARNGQQSTSNTETTDGDVEIWAARKALEMLCRTLMNTNEFMYVD
jgi:mono/diheme cytochrome c family protein